MLQTNLEYVVFIEKQKRQLTRASTPTKPSKESYLKYL